MARPESELTQEELETLIDVGNITRSDAFDPRLSDEEKIAIADGELQSPEND